MEVNRQNLFNKSESHTIAILCGESDTIGLGLKPLDNMPGIVFCKHRGLDSFLKEFLDRLAQALELPLTLSTEKASLVYEVLSMTFAMDDNFPTEITLTQMAEEFERTAKTLNESIRVLSQ